jgi:hypothetical protein
MAQTLRAANIKALPPSSLPHAINNRLHQLLSRAGHFLSPRWSVSLARSSVQASKLTCQCGLSSPPRILSLPRYPSFPVPRFAPPSTRPPRRPHNNNAEPQEDGAHHDRSVYWTPNYRSPALQLDDRIVGLSLQRLWCYVGRVVPSIRPCSWLTLTSPA